MTKIIKGDTSPDIPVALAEGFDYTNATVEIRYQGAVRLFSNCHAGDVLHFNFSADETAPMALGAFPVTVRIRTANGGFFTVDNGGVKIKVTDDPADVYVDGLIAVDAHGMLYGITDLPAHYTDKDVVAKIREILRRGGAAICIALAACSLFGASVKTAAKQDIYNDGQIVTNVDFSGLATTDDLARANNAKDGAARILPKYLWCRDFFDSYADDAAWYYAMADFGGACSSVRDGNAYSRNFDFPYDERAEFVVRMAAGPDRFASVGVSNVGTNLTEAIVTSGKPSLFYKALPGATVDGINECGVAVNINVVCTNGAERTVWAGHEINAVGGVRWVLDHATSAGMAASNLAAKVYIPDALIRKGYSAHFMVADERETWIVEDGVARKVDGRAVLTNFRLYAQDDPFGTGYERYDLLASGGNITSAWFRAAYRRPFTRPTEFAAPGIGTHTETNALVAWADANVPQGAPESLTRSGKSWQTVHCSVYDLSNRVLRVAVQENPDWYVFGIPASGGGGGKVKSVNGKDGEVVLSAADVGAATPREVQTAIGSSGHQTAEQVQMAIENAGHATTGELQPIANAANNALVYASGTYQYMHGNTNAWFEGTNYNVNAEQAAQKTKFVFEDGMDLLTMPCSMALREIREGQKRVVWDQRDWTVWYWNFKSSQMRTDLQAQITGLSENVRTNYMTRGWAKYTAVRGLDNPATDTLWIDTPKVSLMAGKQWEKLIEVGGAGYYTLTGNGIELAPQDTESTFLTIKDFEGNACLTFRKTSSYLVYCECGTDITRNFYDAQGRVVFHLTTDVQPTAEFSTILDTASFIEQGEEGCPANYEWTGTAGNWDCHFLLKPGISSDACFARFKVMREGENVVEHTVPIKINGGIVFEQNGQTLKCKPVAQGTSVGSTVNLVIVQ